MSLVIQKFKNLLQMEKEEMISHFKYSQNKHETLQYVLLINPELLSAKYTLLFFLNPLYYQPQGLSKLE